MTVMSAVILFEFPTTKADARSWILDRAARLALEGTAELKFIGTEQAGSGRETIALEFESTERAHSILSQWRREAGFPRPMEARLLKIMRVPIADAVFP